MSWGRGWEVSARKAIWDHETAQRVAAEILAEEHGTGHVPGSRTDLCPECQAERDAGERRKREGT